MKKNPVLVLTGLAVAAVAGVAGLTRDQWMEAPPQTIAGAETPKAPETAAPATGTAATAPEAVAAAPEAAAPAEPSAASEPAAAAAPAPESAAPAQTAAPAETTAPSETAAPVETAVASAPEAAAPEAVAAPATPAPAEPSAAAGPAEPTVPAPETPTQAATAAEDKEAPIQSAPAPVSTPAPATETAAPSLEVPAFDTVRVEKTGEAVIAGTAEAGSEVVIKLDGATIGKTTANDEGAFVVVPDAPLPAGGGALTIESTGKGDKVATASEQTVAVIVPEQPSQEALVAVLSPNEPTKVLQKPEARSESPPQATVAAAEPGAEPETPAVEEPAAGTAAPEPVPAAAVKQVSLDSVDYDAGGNIVFSGRGQPGHGARVYVDNAHSGDAVIGADGRWSFAGTADIAMGVHALRVDGIDAAGKVLNRIEVPFFREETRKVAAAVPEQTVAPAEQKTDQEPSGEAVATAAEQPAAAAPEKPKDGRVVIQPGNNLWRISKVLYGSGTKYTLLYEANKDQIRDPDRIYPGQVFMTPDVVAPAGTVDPKLREPMKPESGTASAQ